MFVKNSQSKTIINTDDSLYHAILSERKLKKQRQQVCQEMDQLRDELNEIRAMLQKVMQNG